MQVVNIQLKTIQFENLHAQTVYKGITTSFTSIIYI